MNPVGEARANPTLAGRAGGREWIGLGVIALPCLLYSVDLFVAATLRHVRPGGADLAAATPRAGAGRVGRAA